MRNATLIYNSAAGRFSPGPLLSRAVHILEKADWRVEIAETKEGSDIPSLVKAAVDARKDAIFAAGGDGSVGSIAAGLVGSKTAIGVLPTGTANVWARELGLQRLDWAHLFALDEAASRLAHGHIRQVDLGECNGKPFLLWAGLGLDAEVVNAIEPRERWTKAFGVVPYATQAVLSSINWDGLSLNVESMGKVWDDKFLLAIASNIRSYAGGFIELSPDAKIDDGMLDFWLIDGDSLKDVLTRVVQVFRGELSTAPGVHYFKAQEAVFKAEQSLYLQIDGEPCKLDSPIEFSVHHRALRAIIPVGSGNSLFEGG